MSKPNVPQTREEWDAFAAEVRQALESAREAILGRMGYGSYEEYRGSYLWRKIKKRIFAKYDGKCFRCGGHAEHVHHRSYTEAVLSGDNDEQLRPLCGGCHNIVEYDDTGKWRSASEKERVLFEKEISRDYPRPILDFKRKKVKVLNSPNFQRMNSLQWRAWLNEFHWIAFTTKSPDMANTNPDAYARLKAEYDATKQYGVDAPADMKQRRARRRRK